jgi:hypothetical protein
MTRTFQFTFFSVLAITSHLLVSTPSSASWTPSSASCNLTNTQISLQANNQPITEILKDIEKQIDYNLVFTTNMALTNRKTIELNQSPLNLSLHRLLKGQNYSVICNDKLKTLTLRFFDKQKTLISQYNNRTVATTENEISPGSRSMDGIEAAFEEYNNTPISQTTATQQTSMDEVTDVFEEYNNKDTLPVQVPIKQKTSMDGASEAFEEYRNNKDTLPTQVPAKQQTSMDGVSDVFEEYDNNKDTLPVQVPIKQQTSMDGVSEAFEEYHNSSNL